jgi:outer membrane protein
MAGLSVLPCAGGAAEADNVSRRSSTQVHPKHRAHQPSADLAVAKAPTGPAADRWLVTVNAKVMLAPSYPGAARYSPFGFPTLSFRRPGEPEHWASPDDHLSVRLYETPIFAIGPVLSYSGGRYDMSHAIGALKGVHDIRWTLEGGLFAEAWLLPNTFRLRGEIRHGFRAENGFVGLLGADWVSRADRFTFAIGPRLKLGDDKFMNDTFGVTDTDVLAMPTLSFYKPRGGLYSAGLYGSATYKQSEQWSYTVHGGYDRLTDQAAKSPIVKIAGSQDQWTVGATASYTFEVDR